MHWTNLDLPIAEDLGCEFEGRIYPVGHGLKKRRKRRSHP
jgi:hypothetical protein